MEADPQWQQYVKERLEPRNALESVFAWKCGRPTVHEPSEPRLLSACLPGCACLLCLPAWDSGTPAASCNRSCCQLSRP